VSASPLFAGILPVRAPVAGFSGGDEFATRADVPIDSVQNPHVRTFGPELYVLPPRAEIRWSIAPNSA
jgi:hypothetical protein